MVFLSNPDTSTEVSLTPERTTGNTQVLPEVNFAPFTTTEVIRALKELNPRKPAVTTVSHF